MLPLKDRTVLITRAANQVEDFVNQLQDLGANTITLPLIKNRAINKNELTEHVPGNNYDWIIFTSVNAAKYFFETISTENITSKIAVVGEKTASTIQQLGLTVDFTPSKFTAKHLATEIPVVANQRILIPRSNLAKNDIVEILENRDCVIKAITIYENNLINYTKEEIDKIFKQKIDFITFTSGSSVLSFVQLGVAIVEEKIICIGPETAMVAQENKIDITAIAHPHTIEGIMEAIIEN